MMIGVMIGVTIITFTISHLIPGDPAQLMAGPRAGAEVIAKIRADLGLDKSILHQYAIYIGDLLQGDFGTSIVTRRPVLPELLSYLPATVELTAIALVLSIIFGVTLGVLSAVYANRWPDHVVRTLAILGISTPRFVTGLFLLLIFYGWLGIFPGVGRFDPALIPPPEVTGFLLIDCLLAGDLPAFNTALSHLVLPALTLAIATATAGGYMRLVRSSMLEALSEDYIRTARAMGLRQTTILVRHALRNALLPFVTVIGMSIALLLFGSVVVETIFAWPGMGSYVLAAIFALDFPIIMGFTVLVSIVYVLTNLLVDVVYMLIDPQIREVG